MATSNATKQKTSGSDSISKLVERTIQRNINGVSYFVSPDPPVGQTPKDVIHRRGTLSLFHYRPQTDDVYRTPMLIVSPTSNRSFCLDIMPGVSFVDHFCRKGYDVFLMDWAPPRPEEKTRTLEDYAHTFIRECIDIVQKTTGERDVSLVGYCMGGVLATIYTASFKNEFVRNLVCFTTPVDFSKMGMFHKLSSKENFNVDQLVDSVGNIPPSFVKSSFEANQPSLQAFGRLDLWKKMHDAEYVDAWRRYNRWANDTLPIAGEYFRETIKELMWGNKLLKGTLRVGGRTAELANINVPLFHATALHDNLVNREASAPLVEHVSSEDKMALELKGGHISLVAGASAVTRMWPSLDTWLSERSI